MKALRGIRLPSYVKAVRLSRKLTVLNQATGTYEPFVLNQEQKYLLRTLLKFKRVRTGKGRQIGSTTVHAFVLLLALLMNPGLPCCACADSWDNSEGVLKKIAHWLKQNLGLKPTTDNVRELELANGASVVARTALQPGGGNSGEDGGAKESRTGRSKSFGIVLATERSFWRNAKAVWGALTSALLGDARLWDESTGAPGDGAFRQSFEVPADTDDGWTRVFIGVEAHVGYRIDEAAVTQEEKLRQWGVKGTILTDKRWEELRTKYGFVLRSAATWWEWKLRGDFAGDEQRMLREYPVKPEHMFWFKEGQHITRWRVADVEVDGSWNWYRKIRREVELDEDENEVEHDTFGEPVVMGVDTAHGLGGNADASAIALVGHKTKRILATWRNNATSIPKFQAFCDDVVKRFRPVVVVVESNGPGAAVYQHAQLHYPHPAEQWSGAGDGEVWERRDKLRDAIERESIPIGGDLVMEAQSSNVMRRTQPDGRIKPVFVGKDDVLSAVSFCTKWIEQNPYEAPPSEEIDREHFHVKERLAAKTRRDVTHF